MCIRCNRPAINGSEYCRACLRIIQAERRNKGKCIYCGKQAIKDEDMCVDCKVTYRLRTKGAFSFASPSTGWKVQPIMGAQ